MALPHATLQALVDLLGSEAEVRPDEPLSRHTTLRIGGCADVWVAPRSIAAVQRLRAFLFREGIACAMLGAGSNLLVRDGGVRGVVLSSDHLRGLHIEAVSDEVTRVVVEAGVSTGKLLSEALRRGLTGVEFLGGVPGSVGGGLMMNAGTYLGEFKDTTQEVATVGPDGALRTRSAAACGFVYRGSDIPRDEVIVWGVLLLRPGDRQASEEAVRALRARRKAREPHGVANAGSFFKNPPGDFAGRLIEAAGLKGERIGGAEVSAVHANWIVNASRAKACDVLALIERVRARVAAVHGVALELEVRLLGSDEDAQPGVPHQSVGTP